MKERKAAIKLFCLSGLSLAAVGIGIPAIWRAIPHGPAGSTAVSQPHNVAKTGVADRKAVVFAPRAGEMDSRCAILLTRTIFASQVPHKDGATSSSASSAASAANFALKGISQENSRFTAFVEDAAARRIVEVHVGDVLGQGQVRDLNLHELAYELAGNLVHVEIGRALDGVSYAAVGPVKADSSLSNHPEHKKHHGEAPVTDIEDGH